MMKRIHSTLSFSAISVLAGLVLNCPAEEPTKLLACEQSGNRILILDANLPWSDPKAVLAEWRASNDRKIHEAHRAWFQNPTDAKASGEDTIVTVATGGSGPGGVAILSRENMSVIAYGDAGASPHSVLRLPSGHIITASSSDDLLRLFAPPGHGRLEGLQDLKLIDAHGLVLDDKRQCIWALGGKEIQQLSFEETNSRLIVRKTIPLPVTDRSRQYERHGGHDIVWDPDGTKLLISDMDDLWIFDPSDKSFTPLVDRPVQMVKSIAPSSNPGRFLLMQATTNWWSDSIRNLEGERKHHMPGARFYKVRWID